MDGYSNGVILTWSRIVFQRMQQAFVTYTAVPSSSWEPYTRTVRLESGHQRVSGPVVRD